MFAVVNAAGQIEFTARTIDDAVEEAYDRGAEDVYVDAAGEDRKENAAVADVKLAVKQLGKDLRGRPLRIPDSALTLDLEEAWERFRCAMPPYVHKQNVYSLKRLGTRVKGSPASKTPVQAMEKVTRSSVTRDPAQTADKLVSFMLTENAKLKKSKEGIDLDILGINLLPYWQYAENPGPYGLAKRRHLPNLCAGSSAACRNSCLVYSGRNYSNDWTIVSKGYRTHMLYTDPEAFGRLMYQALLEFLGSTRAKRSRAARLNVLSDVPWEEIFPALFPALPAGMPVYDYTKVARRNVPPNYDLTFSYSGTNMPAVQEELGRGRRVAVVVLGTGFKKEQYEETWANRLPKFLRAGGRRIPVVDGDKHDARFLDPEGSIVALRWKAPVGASQRAAKLAGKKKFSAKQRAAFMEELGREALKSKFVLEVEQLGDMVVAAVTPGDQPDAAAVRTVYDRDELLPGVSPGGDMQVPNPAGWRRRPNPRRKTNPRSASLSVLVRSLKF
ncbi:MAG TPA: hypothetical protein ENJ85_05055 [Oceanithermus profundus]|uniref:Gene product 88 domain-containing protein n=1 Tax=Oceanithermus profundus TaxID=187137 RepID=A0A7C5SQ57_9DEIN|nr:hypothetical protein [Oceanithermus profundus]